MEDDTDLLLIQNRVLVRMMELYDARAAEREKISKTSDSNVKGVIDTIYAEVEPFMATLQEQGRLAQELEREAMRKYYEQLASILVEMIPVLADAIAVRLKEKHG